jgi:hypothetical protein
MACLNADADKGSQAYKNFDIENMQPDQHANGSSSAAAARKNGSNRRGCSLPLLLSLAALILSLVALVCGVYGAVTARRLGRGPTDQGVYLTTNPQDAPSGYQAVNLFKVIKSGVALTYKAYVCLADAASALGQHCTCTWQEHQYCRFNSIHSVSGTRPLC